jgi:hypothetical protein
MAFLVTRRGARPYSYRGTGAIFAQLTTGAGSAKGAWTEFSAALPVAIRTLDVRLLGGETGVWYILDIGIGAAGAEVVILPNLLFQSFTDFAAECRTFRFPYALPAGTRLAMRGQNNTGLNKAVRAALMGHAGGTVAGMQRGITYGVNLATSLAVNIDPGAVANTKGAWVQMAATTTYPIRHLTLAVVPVSSVSFMSWALDIGIGAAGAEVVLVPDVTVHAADIGRAIGPTAESFDVNVPAGVRLAIRAACESTASPARVLAAALTGMG